MAELTVPKIDFSPLANLPQVYKQAQQQRMRDQTLAALGQGGGADADTLIKSGDLSLAQLGLNLKTQQMERERQAQRDAISDQHWAKSYSLQERQANRADDRTPTGFEPNPQGGGYRPIPGGPSDPNYIKQKEEAAGSGKDDILQVIEKRKIAAAGLGMTPDSPGYQSYVATGKMPKEDAQPLTATDKKAILEADEKVQGGQQVIENLTQAKKLSKEAFSGVMADKRGYAASFLGSSSDIGKAGIATTDLNNLVTTNALQQLKAIFGGSPTEGERAILLEIQGSASQPDEVRQKIYDRAIRAAKSRLAFEQQRADELRGGSFYKKDGGTSKNSTQPTSANGVPEPPKLGEVRGGYRFKGGNPGDPTSWVKVAE